MNDSEERLAQAERSIAQLYQEIASLKSGLINPPRLPASGEIAVPLRIVDEKGVCLLAIEKDPDKGHFAVRLYNADGNVAVAFGVNGGGGEGWLSINNRQGAVGGYLSIEDAGTRLLLNDSRGDTGLGIGLFAYGELEGNGINIIQEEGDGISLWTGPAESQIRVTHSSDAPAVELTATATAGRVHLTNAQGETVVSEP